MLRRFVNKYRGAKLYLGVVSVVPRKDIKRYLDQLGIIENSDLDTDLRARLLELFQLPSASEVVEPTGRDVGLDLLIPTFQSGDAWSVNLGDIGFPLIWRPKVEIASRLFRLDSGKTLDTFSVTAKLSWRQYLARMFTFRSLFRFKPMFDSSDMQELLDLACYDLISKMRKAL